MSEKKKVKHAWFSAKQATIAGTCFYERLEGGEVEVTCVANDGNHGCHWDDMEFVGEVLDYKRRGIESRTQTILGPSWDDSDMWDDARPNDYDV